MSDAAPGGGDALLVWLWSPLHGVLGCDRVCLPGELHEKLTHQTSCIRHTMTGTPIVDPIGVLSRCWLYSVDVKLFIIICFITTPICHVCKRIHPSILCILCRCDCFMLPYANTSLVEPGTIAHYLQRLKTGNTAPLAKSKISLTG